jgi:serine/threonine-protein kinase
MSLHHPNICRVHDFGLTESKIPYLVMDWVNGVSLGRKILRDQRLPVCDAIRIYQQTASALAHAHQNKLVHRDLKPENLMLNRDVEGRTEVQLVDFGIAKSLDGENGMQGLTKTGLIVGTPVYMSPEQARAEQIDGRADIYSLACVIFFALSGKPPFLGPTVVDTITKHLMEAPPDFDPSLKVPSDLQKIIYKSMEKDPADRYSSMEEVLADLKKLTKGVSLDHKASSRDRQRAHSRMTLIIWFALGFITMYAISIALQAMMGDGRSDRDIERNKPGRTNHANPTSRS